MIAVIGRSAEYNPAVANGGNVRSRMDSVACSEKGVSSLTSTADAGQEPERQPERPRSHNGARRSLVRGSCWERLWRASALEHPSCHDARARCHSDAITVSLYTPRY